MTGSIALEVGVLVICKYAIEVADNTENFLLIVNGGLAEPDVSVSQ